MERESCVRKETAVRVGMSAKIQWQALIAPQMQAQIATRMVEGSSPTLVSCG